MSVFDAVTRLDTVPQRLPAQDALALRHRLMGEHPDTILEVCQDASQLTLYLAALLEDQGEGTLTSFHADDPKAGPTLKQEMANLSLAHRVASIPSGRSYVWALQRLVAQTNRPVFDVCVINGHKAWEACGFGVVLADMLLRRGGLMVLMDVNWSMATSPYFKERPHLTQKYAQDELQAHPVALVRDILLPHLGYRTIDAPECRNLSLVRKP